MVSTLTVFNLDSARCTHISRMKTYEINSSICLVNSLKMAHVRNIYMLELWHVYVCLYYRMYTLQKSTRSVSSSGCYVDLVSTSISKRIISEMIVKNCIFLSVFIARGKTAFVKLILYRLQSALYISIDFLLLVFLFIINYLIYIINN